ncbi:MAG: DUF998 domain-containing protein [Euryarchaeota archaeon]|nr:DUF998 domain-containing protein [Euryarchaeota archaeon]
MLARILAILGAAGFVVLLAVDHLARRDLDPIERAISDYGRGQDAWIFALALVALALAKVSVGIALVRVGGGPATAGWIFLLDAAATIAVALFPTDLGAETTTSGTLHRVAATIAFLASTAGMLLASLPVRQGSGGTPLAVLAIAGACFVTAFGAAILVGRWEGVAERGQVVSTASWLALYAAIRMG